MDFSKIWGSNGNTSAPTDAQYLQGFEFLGNAPPTSELFNYLFQMLDLKTKALKDSNSALFWQAATAYSVGTVRLPSTFSYKYMECTVAGTSGAAEPTLPAVGSTVTDGSATWIARDMRALSLVGGTMLGAIAMGGYKITGLGDGSANGDAVNKGQLNLAGFHPGDIIFTANSAAPAGFIKANGGTVSRTTYASLFSAIGTTFGVGDGSTTFALPDLRGEFLRCLDDGRGVDSGRTLGSAQGATSFPWYVGGEGGTGYLSIPMANGESAPTESSYAVYSGTVAIASGTTARYYVRPRNVAMLGCIKY